MGLLFLSIAPATPVPVTARNRPRLDRVKNNQELVVGLSADYAPFEFHATVDGKDTIVGFDVSIAEKSPRILGSN